MTGSSLQSKYWKHNGQVSVLSGLSKCCESLGRTWLNEHHLNFCCRLLLQRGHLTPTSKPCPDFLRFRNTEVLRFCCLGLVQRGNKCPLTVCLLLSTICSFIYFVSTHWFLGFTYVLFLLLCSVTEHFTSSQENIQKKYTNFFHSPQIVQCKET